MILETTVCVDESEYIRMRGVGIRAEAEATAIRRLLLGQKRSYTVLSTNWFPDTYNRCYRLQMKIKILSQPNSIALSKPGLPMIKRRTYVKR